MELANQICRPVRGKYLDHEAGRRGQTFRIVGVVEDHHIGDELVGAGLPGPCRHDVHARRPRSPQEFAEIVRDPLLHPGRRGAHDQGPVDVFPTHILTQGVVLVPGHEGSVQLFGRCHVDGIHATSLAVVSVLVHRMERVRQDSRVPSGLPLTRP